MRNRSRAAPRSACPISLALETIGDPWSLLIVRDLMFRGRRRFREFLAGGEGIASNILADRLARLEAAGIVTRQSDPEDARRVVYHLTARGIDLAPMLVELVLWSARYEKTDAPPAILRAMRRDRARFIAEIRAQWRRAAP